MGHPPVLRAPLAYEHLSVISGVTLDGRLFTHIQEQAYSGEHIVTFLRQLLRQIPGKLMVLWDGASIHHGQAVKDFLSAGATARLQLARFPSYAPDLNPDEGVWKLLKRDQLANRCCQDLIELRAELKMAIRRLQRRPHLLRACFRHAGLV